MKSWTDNINTTNVNVIIYIHIGEEYKLCYISSYKIWNPYFIKDIKL